MATVITLIMKKETKRNWVVGTQAGWKYFFQTPKLFKLRSEELLNICKIIESVNKNDKKTISKRTNGLL